MPANLVLRRLVIPYVAIVCAVGLAVAAFAAVRLTVLSGAGGESTRLIGEEIAPIVYFALAAIGLGGVAALIVARMYVRQQRAGILETFSSVTPQIQAGQSAMARGADPADILQAIADSYGSVLAQSSKDKAQLLTILSAMSDGLIALDPEQRIVLVNRAAEQIFSLRADEAAGKPLWEVVGDKAILQEVQSVMLTAQRKTLRAAGIGGRKLEITIARLPRADQRTGLILVAHDITESARYEDLRKEFVANVSHELRTPLTMIKGFVETLRDGAIDDRPRAIRYLETVERHSDQLSNLVNDLLDLSRFDSGLEFDTSSPLHIDAIVRRAVDLMQPAMEKKGHTVEMKIESTLPVVSGNPDYFQRAVANLIENAIKYTPAGGAISVSAGAQDGFVTVEVSDNGIGIAAEDLPRIFERFYRSERSRSREMGGTGLGLSIVKHVVQAHGGTVEVASTMGKGSSFKIKLPVLA